MRKIYKGFDRPPELLFHSIDQHQFDQMIQNSKFQYRTGRSIYCSKMTSYAWQVAHRSFEKPFVAVIDVGQALAEGAVFSKNQKHLWETSWIPSQAILNAHPNFAEQVSAGGMPFYIDNGVPKVLLIQMQRHHFLTWEIAKGKMEIGEHPEQAAIREIQEEIGCTMQLSPMLHLGTAQFSLSTPNGEPRLKSLYVYLFESQTFPQEFHCATNEGVMDAQWFDIDSALQLVTHRSLKNIMRRLRQFVRDMD